MDTKETRQRNELLDEGKSMESNLVSWEKEAVLEETKNKRSKGISWMCLDLSRMSSKKSFLVLAALIFGFYIIYGCVHEYIFQIPGMKDKGWSVTCLQFIFYSLFSQLEMLARGLSRRAPLSLYAFLSVITLGTMGFSNASLQYLNYPTQVIFKSCKLIPVLLGGSLIQGKAYGGLDYLAASIMSVGLILFMSVDIQVNPNFNFLGVLMISIALISDALLGNYQERTMMQFEASNAEISSYTFSLGTLFLFTLLSVFGDIPGTITMFNSNPLHIYGSIFTFSLTGYLGIQVVFTTIRAFGAFNTVLLTSLRKSFTIVLSFLLFGKPFSWGYPASGLVLFLGIYLNLLSKRGYEIKDLLRVLRRPSKGNVSNV